MKQDRIQVQSIGLSLGQISGALLRMLRDLFVPFCTETIPVTPR